MARKPKKRNGAFKKFRALHLAGPEFFALGQAAQYAQQNCMRAAAALGGVPKARSPFLVPFFRADMVK